MSSMTASVGALDFRVLGQLRVLRDGLSVDLRRPRSRELLAFLLLRAGKNVATDELLDALWPDKDPDAARRSLWVHVSNLRKALEPDRVPGNGSGVLVTAGKDYSLRVEPTLIDAVRFESRILEARSLRGSDVMQARTLIDDALSLWTGPPYADLAYVEFVQVEIRRLEELRLSALEDRLRAALDMGDHRAVLDEVRHLIDEHPLRESLRGIEMLAWYRAGEQTKALRCYQEIRLRLSDELGILPSPALQRLEDRILLQDPELDLPRSEVPSTNLLHRVDRLVGRATDVNEVRQILKANRLVTLTGPGGVGKSSLAVEAARVMVDDQPDGVWFVDLAAASDASLISQSIASAMGVTWAVGDDVKALAASLTDRRLLLILDNCEHVNTACAAAVDAILKIAPHVSILATSRQPLYVAGEIVWRVEPLSVPEPTVDLDEARQYGAVELLCERVIAGHRGFRLNENNVEAVIEICARVDGIPLAIELAAPHVGVLGAREVADRLGEHYELFQSDLERLEPRHRSLIDSVDWSYRLLDDEAQLVFDRLSVFDGSFDLQAAEAVVSAAPIPTARVVPLLESLVEFSMVQPIDGDFGRRYRLLDVLREYGSRSLGDRGEATELGRRHAAFFRELSLEAGRAMKTPQRSSWVSRIALEYPNLRSAVHWSLENEEPLLALQFIEALGHFWRARAAYATEGLALSQRMLDFAGDAPPRLRARVLLTIATELSRRGHLDEATKRASEATELLENTHDVETLIDSLNFRGAAALVRDPDQAEEMLDRALELGNSTTYRHGMALTRLFLGYAAGGRGDWEHARPHLEEAGRILEAYGGCRPYSGALGQLGQCSFIEKDVDTALLLIQQSIGVGQRVGAREETIYGFNALAVIHAANGDNFRAALALERALDSAGGNALQSSTSLGLIAAIAVQVGLASPAAELLAAARTILRRRGMDDFSRFTLSTLAKAEGQIERHLGASDLEEAYGTGADLDDDQAVALGYSLLHQVQRESP